MENTLIPFVKSLEIYKHHFEKIYIDTKSLDSKLAQRILNLFPQDKIALVDEDPFKNHKGNLSAEQFDKSKKILHIKPFAGYFFKRCPGASQKKILNCCNYHVLNLGQQCNMNCSYCYLQSYLNTPATLIYSNIDKALAELKEMADQFPQQPFRVGTGEVIDSLSLDEITLYSRELIQFFNNYPKWTLEFKTKSDKVDQFLDCQHASNTVVSWSMNAPQIIESEEHGTANLTERILAAKKCKEKKFPVAFHIDPLIYFPDWKEGYAYLVESLTKNFQPKDVHAISLGALRFQPEQRHMMKERFGLKSYVTSAEMFPSEGNKLRYDQSLRKEMFNFVLDLFKANNPKWRIFLCMETPETWISSFDQAPIRNPQLKDLFKPLPKITS